MFESKSFNNVKINNLNGIKRKLTFGTFLITTSLLLSLAGTNKVYAENVMVDMPSFNSLKSTSEKARDVLEDVKEEYNSNKKLEMKYNTLFSYVDRYSTIYNLNSYKVEYIIGDNTNIISDDIINKTDKEIEIMALKIVKDIKRNPDDYGIEKGQLEELRYTKDLSIREIVKYYSDLFDIDSNLVFAIECFESGYYESDMVKAYNNPGSLRGNGDFYKYDNIEQGIISHVLTLKEYYIDKGLDTPDKMQSIYCPDGSNWAENVNIIYNDINNNEECIKIYDEKEFAKGVK